MRTPASLYERSRRVLPDPPWGRDFRYDFELEACRVGKSGRVHTHSGAFLLSTVGGHAQMRLLGPP